MLDHKIMQMKDEIVEKVQECVRIKSVLDPETSGANMPFGQDVQSALQFALDLSRSMGFNTYNLDNMIGYAEYGSGEEMVAVLGHLDVVPEGDGWTYPPYAAEIHDGKIYGRGVLDNKGAIIGALYALKAIKDLNIKLNKRIRVIFGTNEESGSKCAKYYTEREELPVAGFTPDACYPIINGEKGIANCTFKKTFYNKATNPLLWIKGGTAINSVPAFAEAALVWTGLDKGKVLEIARKHQGLKVSDEGHLLVKAQGVTAHGGTPELGVNAISILFAFLGELELGDEFGEFVDFYNKYIGFQTTGEALGISMKDEISGALTVNLGTMEGNEHTIRFKITFRSPVTKKFEDVESKLFDLFLGHGIEAEDYTNRKSLYVSPETEFIKKLQKVYTEKTGQEARLISFFGSTYAKAMCNIVAFGPVFEGEPDLCHQPDEYMSIENLIKNTQIIAAAMYELGS